MSRKLTTYTRPSLADQIATAPTIERLGRLVVLLELGLTSGKLEPEAKTINRWREALWRRIGELLVAAESAGEACYVFNATRAWPLPATVRAALEQLLAKTVARLPNDVELLARRGVVIEGVSTPEQIQTARLAVEHARRNVA